MEKIIYSSPETAPDNLTIIKRTYLDSKCTTTYISSFGAPLSLFRKRWYRLGFRNRHLSPAAKNYSIDKPAYSIVHSQRNPLDNKTLHRLLARTFFGEDYIKGKEIHHLNNNGFCNRLDNIILVSREEHAQIHKQIRSGQIIITNLQKSLFYVTQ